MARVVSLGTLVTRILRSKCLKNLRVNRAGECQTASIVAGKIGLRNFEILGGGLIFDQAPTVARTKEKVARQC